MENLEKIHFHKNVSVHNACPIFFFFLFSRANVWYCSTLLLVTLLADRHNEDSWHLSTSKPPNSTRTHRLWVLARGKITPHLCFLQVPDQMGFQDRGRTTFTSYGLSSSITLQCFSVFCCCSLSSEFGLCYLPYQHAKEGSEASEFFFLHCLPSQCFISQSGFLGILGTESSHSPHPSQHPLGRLSSCEMSRFMLC